MAWRNTRIEKASDDADGNEQFYIVQFDASLHVHQPGHIKETKGPLREAVVRDFFKKFGQSDDEVDEMLRAARAKAQ